MVTADRPIIDFERTLDPADEARTSARRTRFLASPQRRYLTIDGHSPTGGEAFQRAIAELYPVVYTLHFMLKACGVSAPIGRLEGG